MDDPSSPSAINSPKGRGRGRGRGHGRGRGRGRGRGQRPQQRGDSSQTQAQPQIQPQPTPQVPFEAAQTNPGQRPQNRGKDRRDDIGSYNSRAQSTETEKSSTQEPSKTESGESQSRRKRALETLTKGHSELTSRMITMLMGNNYECMVCVEKIGRAAAVWSCKSCYHLFHIKCIKDWRKSSVTENGSWKCPGCRFNYTQAPKVTCFCGKLSHEEMSNFSFNSFTLPHSCGEMCGKTREGTNCPHSCALLCHPGPCPECAALAPPKNCYCGKSVYQKRCGVVDEGESCGETCDKPLSCGQHTCQQVCHAGPCKPCSIQIPQKCYCGKETSSKTCGTKSATDSEDSSHGEADPRHYSCGKTCGKLLSCGVHHCADLCHKSTSDKSPQCPPCPLLPSELKSCPCGKVALSSSLDLHKDIVNKAAQRKQCTDPVPTCGHICGKTLPCGMHKCSRPCHTGGCSDSENGPLKCEQVVSIPCRCGNPRGAKELKCYDVYPNNFKQAVQANTCKKTCTIMRDCGRHQCGIRCCPVQIDPNDPEGLHICKIVCNKPLPCGLHKCAERCHKGRCPTTGEGGCFQGTVFTDRVCPCGRTTHFAPIPCGQKPPVCHHPCTKVRTCGHPMTPHQCHWEGSCPDCVILVEKSCAGGHTKLPYVACYVQSPSCGMPCNKPMACGYHVCSRVCHAGPCEIPITKDETSTLPLEQNPTDIPPKPSCGHRCRKQLTSCHHTCKLPCHPGRVCPTSTIRKCDQKTKVTCECGRLSEERPCIGLASTIQLTCDDICRKEHRQRKMAEAFGILPTTKPPSYSDFLLQMARAAPQFVANIEAKFNHFLHISDLRIRLPDMDTVQRKVVHELAKYYNLDTESIGVEPNRHVQLVKKTGSKVPTVPLSQMAKFEHQYSSGNTASSAPGSSGSKAGWLASALHIYDLSVNVKTHHLENFLTPYAGSYTLHWIDESNAIAVFNNEQQMRKALGSLTGGLFKVKAYMDANPTGAAPGTDGLMALKGKVKPQAAPKPLSSSNSTETPSNSSGTSQEFLPSKNTLAFSEAQSLINTPAEMPWHVNANPYRALDGEADSMWDEKETKLEEVDSVPSSAPTTTTDATPVPAASSTPSTSSTSSVPQDSKVVTTWDEVATTTNEW